MRFLWDFYEIFVGFLWDLMGFYWDFYGLRSWMAQKWDF